MAPSVRKIIVLIICFIVVLSLYYFDSGGNRFEFAVLDVGQGQCIVFRTPEKKTIVIDCGSTSSRNSGKYAANTAANFLKYRGVNRIDLAVLSHPHDDHVNGFPHLVKNIYTDKVIDLGLESASPEYYELLKIIKQNGIKYETANRGMTAKIDNKTTLTILHPAKGHTYPDLNENSMVIRTQHGSVSFLVASDVGSFSECEILSESLNIKSTVLVVGHHGSESGSSIEWLSAVRPRVAVISVGNNNKYGLPSKEVLLRLDALKVKVYRTDLNGAIVFSTDGSDLSVKKYN